jgi:hypothetical protein
MLVVVVSRDVGEIMASLSIRVPRDVIFLCPSNCTVLLALSKPITTNFVYAHPW